LFLVILLGDKLVGEVSRLVVAEACIQALDIESTEDNARSLKAMDMAARGGRELEVHPLKLIETLQFVVDDQGI